MVVCRVAVVVFLLGMVANAGTSAPASSPWIAVKDPASGRTYHVHTLTRKKQWTRPSQIADEDTTMMDAAPPMLVPWTKRPFGETVGLSDKELKIKIEAWLDSEEQREREGRGPRLVNAADYNYIEQEDTDTVAIDDGGFTVGSYSKPIEERATAQGVFDAVADGLAADGRLGAGGEGLLAGGPRSPLAPLPLVLQLRPLPPHRVHQV